ncbi:MAG: Crp/Fnr family transcriptional regulator [Chloroflexota bacterium]
MLTDNQQIALLGAYPVLRLLPPQLWRVVVVEGKAVNLLAGSIAFDEASPCLSYLMVTAGAVRVVKPINTGRELLLYRVQPGESCILTVSCLLGECSYQACGSVEADLVCVVVPRAVFLQMVEQSSEFRTYIFRFFGERVTHLMELIESVAFRKLDRRLAQFLLKNSPVIEVTHQRLAAELGSVREVVSRILEDFRTQGIVQLDRGQIHVLDEQALERLSHLG